MHVNTQIRRGLERCIASNEAARLEGLYGMAGLSAVDNFNALEGLLEESGFSGAKGHVKLLRRRCDNVSNKMVAAVPVAKRAMELMEEHNGDLGSIFSKIGNVLKKAVKIGTSLSPSAIIAKKLKIDKFSPSQILASRISAPKTPPATAAQITAKAQAKADKKAAAAAAKQAKADAKAAAKKAKADAKAAAALARAQVAPGTTPVDAGAAVLANQAGVNLTTEQAAALAQQVAANIAQPGSTTPSASMFAAPSDAGGGAPAASDTGSSGPFGLSTPVLIGGAAVVLGGLYLATRKKGRR